jgi:hypothetical protein
MVLSHAKTHRSSSMPFFATKEGVDARHTAGHDVERAERGT